MNILVINDDGINSPSLWALAEALGRVGNVVVVAPDNQKSGSGSCVTMSGSFTVNEVPPRTPGVQAYAHSGMPCDCTSWGLRKLGTRNTHLVVSGINLGPNVGFDIPYSGTVMATLTSHLLRIPSVAVSLDIRSYKEEMRFDAASSIAGSLARCMDKGGMRTDAIININVPNIPLEQIKGILATKSAHLWYINLRRSATIIANSSDATSGRAERFKFEQGTDVWAINEGYISITPVRFEITANDLFPDISRCLQDLDFRIGGK